ncbi:MAG: LuxR C-terminal-related transcriptional regulator [Pigmentiphaga sp.]|uniref:LuxR C-terminal-related transcriptional regulator n=1 Tax=Pigmentiphaga sp. TaxID=1977564 RepID=UPI0029B95CF3|nr:LuxR C-terminal-related transcriptional regulator [Pigmentiphaga sp.]MDX3904981.1 LuxR C-terminal-related transcriptional regulator [Pigmentiphaga sp.]
MTPIASALPDLAFELAPVGLLVTRDRVIERCNRAFADMFGYTRQQLLGHTTEMLYPSHAEYEDIGARGVRAMLAAGIYRDERIMLHRNGEMFWCAVSGQPVDPEQPYACAVWAFEDLRVRRPLGMALTPREREISALILAGRTSKQIAKDLMLSPRTVETYRLRLMRKLEVKTVGELVSRMLALPAVP